MHVALWLPFAIIALVFWGITGVTQKLSTNAITSELSFLWFALAFVPIALVIMLVIPLDWHFPAWVFWVAVLGGMLNGLGALTSFAALEKGGKASIVIPLCYLFPLVTVVVAITFLRETITRTQGAGIVLALVAAGLLSQEAPPQAQKPE